MNADRTVARPDDNENHRRIEELLRQFGGGIPASTSWPGGREAALFDIFRHCGLSTRQELRLDDKSGPMEVDGDIEMEIEGRSQRIAIEIKGSSRPEFISRAIEHARRIRHVGRYDRALVVVAGDLPESLRRQAEGDGIGYIDLLGIPELRSWLWKHAPALQPSEAASEPTCAQIIREAMRAIAERLVRAPEEIATIEWRDMERVLREVFEGMRFVTTLTRSGRDGGFDLELETNVDGIREVYLVEVKHWSAQKPGRTHLRKLVRVTARQKANLGILLSTSGFAPSIYEGFTEAERGTVALGGREKIIGLCTTYYRLGEQIWSPGSSMTTQLLDGLM